MDFPIVIKSSPKALKAKYIPKVVVIALLLVGAIFSPSQLAIAITALALFLSLVFAVDTLFAYLRIKNTTYTVYSNLIQETSYTFKIFGIKNNSVNLTQLRQIQAFSNSQLDVFFFKCGKVKITSSGDVTDFTLSNLYNPMKTKRLIENICFKPAPQNIQFSSSNS